METTWAVTEKCGGDNVVMMPGGPYGSEEIALGFPFPSAFVDNLAESNHMISLRTQHCTPMEFGN